MLLIERAARPSLRGVAAPPTLAESRNLDLLRAIAVLLVYACHLLWPVLDIRSVGPFGHDLLGRAGVMFFFVHTCLVLLMSLDRTPLAGWRLVGHFYLRRAFRIYPLSIVTVCLMAAFRIPAMPSETYVQLSPGELAANLALVQNISHSRDVLGPLWSLPWEVQMYLAIPFLFLALRKSRWKGVAWGMWAAAVLLRCGGLAAHVRILSLLAYTPCFLAGAIAWRACRDGARPRWSGALWPVAIGVAAVLYLALAQVVPHEPGFLGSYAACIFLGISLPYFRELPESPITVAARSVAKYSYGIYLSHVPVLWIVHVPLAQASPVVRWGFLAAASVVIPVVLFHFVEEPLIRAGKRVATRFFNDRPRTSERGSLAFGQRSGRFRKASADPGR